ncbi:MAG: phage tail protein [Desulfobacteraceae bacterium]|nr:phage tail protein [Desulfobacteraceae bacterium]
MANTYITNQGDTFDIIAFKLWSNENLMDRLVDANPQYQNTVFFNAGIVLNVPDIETPINTDPVPPWQS